MPKVKLVDVAQEKILEMIEKNQYDEKGYLPSEGELTIRFDMSRATVREAVRSMEVRGFVKRIHGKGVLVLDNSQQVLTRSISDMMIKGKNILDDLLELREVLEPKSAALASKRHNENDLEILENYVRIMEKSKIMDSEYYNADLAFHTELARISGNRLIESLIAAYNPILSELIIDASHADTPLEQEFHYHRNILKAVEEKKPDDARRTMREHITAAIQNRDKNYK
ncbi:MAG: FCD domain-containing protein [Clostridia bacterium]